VVLFRDPDASGTLDPPDDYYTSFAEAVVLYLEGTPDEDQIADGLHAGWNARGYHPADGIDLSASLDPSDLSLRQNLFPNGGMRLEGSYDLETDPSLINIMLTSPTDLQDGEGVITVFDRAIEVKDGQWHGSLNNAPPAAHRGLAGLDDNAAVESVYAYAYGEAGVFESSDQIQGVGCYGEQKALPVHVLPATGEEAALRYLSRGLAPGWSLYLVNQGKGMRPAPQEAQSQVDISDICRR
jgi:hypothetical protein